MCVKIWIKSIMIHESTTIDKVECEALKHLVGSFKFASKRCKYCVQWKDCTRLEALSLLKRVFLAEKDADSDKLNNVHKLPSQPWGPIGTVYFR